MVTKFLVVAFLLAHAAIHASFLAPAPAATATGPQWPFDLGRSWALSPLGLEASIVRAVGVGLVAAVFAAYGVAILSVIGILPRDVAVAAVAAGSLASMAVLALYFNVWFVTGLAIDLVLIWLSLGNWSPDALGS